MALPLVMGRSFSDLFLALMKATVVGTVDIVIGRQGVRVCGSWSGWELALGDGWLLFQIRLRLRLMGLLAQSDLLPADSRQQLFVRQLQRPTSPQPPDVDSFLLVRMQHTRVSLRNVSSFACRPASCEGARV